MGFSELDFLFGDINVSNVSSTNGGTTTSTTTTINQKMVGYNLGNRDTIFKNFGITASGATVVYQDSGTYGTNGIMNSLKAKNYNNNSAQNPYIKLLNDFNSVKSGKSTTIKPADIIYLKKLGVNPINRLFILRRFAEVSLYHSIYKIKRLKIVHLLLRLLVG